MAVHRKSVTIVFWMTTILFAALMAFSATSYLTQPDMAAAFSHLGFPNYFRIELAIAKFIGVVLLLLPKLRPLNEWAYAGFFIVLVSACVGHTAVADPLANRIMPAIIGLLWLASYLSRNAVYTKCSPSAQKAEPAS